MSNILKKIPLNTDLDDLYGKVKTVNSIRPDDDGNVLIKIPPVYEYNFLFNGVGYNSLVDALNNAKKDAANLLIVQNDVNLDDSERIEDSNGYKSIPDIDFDLEIDLNGNVLTSNKVHTDNSSGYIYGTLFHITGYSFYAHDGTIVTEPIGEYSFGPAVIFHLDNPYSDNTYTFTNLNLSSYSNDDGYCKTSDGT